MNQRIIILSCLFFYLPQIFAQQSTIKGIVSIHNSETYTGKRQYVSNVQVEDDLKKATPTITDFEGQFKLIFVGLETGKSVTLQVKKPGLQIVDETKLRAVTGQEETINISVANPDSIAEYRVRLFNIGKTQAQKALEKKLQQISGQLAFARNESQLNNIKIKELEEQYALIEQQKKTIEDQAAELARKYAPVNLDDASPIFRKAFFLFQSGFLDSSLFVLENAQLNTIAMNIVEEGRKLEILKKEIGVRDSVQQKRIYDAGQALLLKADLLKTQFAFDSARECFELLIKMDSSNATYLSSYAYFLQSQKQFDRAIHFNKLAVNILEGGKPNNREIYEGDLSIIMNNLGILYLDKNDLPNAEKYCNAALEIRQRIAKKDPKEFAPSLANTQNCLGNIYSTKNDFIKAEKAYNTSLEIYQRFAPNFPQIFKPEIAGVQNNIGLLYFSNKNFLEAEKAYQIAIDIYEQLSKSYFQDHQPSLAKLKNNLGNLYSDLNIFFKAEDCYNAALDIYKQLSKRNPQTYESDLAGTQNNLGILYKNNNNLPKAENSYTSALETYLLLVKNDPQTYEPILAKVENNLGVLYKEKNDFLRAENTLLKSLEIYQRLAKTTPQIYDPHVATTQANLGNLYSNQNDSLKAIKAFQIALDILMQLSKKEPQLYESDLANTQSNLGVFYMDKGDFPKAQKYYKAAIEIYKSLVKKNAQTYEPDFALAQFNLGILFIKEDNFGEAEVAYKSAFQLYQRLKKDNAERYDVLFKTSKTRLIKIYLEESWHFLTTANFTKANQKAIDGLGISPNETLLKSNLAHALLFQGKYEEAKKIYAELKTLKTDTGKSFTQICLADLDELEKKGITNNYIGQIKQFLKQ